MRTYVASISPAGTVTVQIQQKQTLKRWMVTWQNAAAGAIELSTSPTSQIATAQPDPSVIARVKCGVGGANGNTSFADIPISLPVVAFQNLYLHATGAGNIGESILQ